MNNIKPIVYFAMKTTRKLRSVLAGVGFVSLLSITLFSCLKDNNSYVTAPTALLMVVQGSPDAPAEDLYLNNNRVTTQAFNYGDRVGYFNAYIGSRKIILNNYGTQTLIASDTATLNVNVAYSMFLANTYTKPDFVLLKDTITQPASGKAAIRFVDVSPDAGAVDLIANSSVLVSNKSYKGSSSFVPVAGDANYTFEVHKAGTATVLASLGSTAIKSGGVYTIWLHGLTAGSTTTKLSVDVIANAFY
jgi:hypothetical protein